MSVPSKSGGDPPKQPPKQLLKEKDESDLKQALSQSKRSGKEKYVPVDLGPPVKANSWANPNSFYSNVKPPAKTEAMQYPTLPTQVATGPVKGGLIEPKSNLEQWKALKPEPVKPQEKKESEDFGRAKNRLAAWNKLVHDGTKVTLSEEEISALEEYAYTFKSKSGKSRAFNVVRGDGTGEWSATDQLKVIAIHQDLIGDKRPTFHFTLKD